jgi:hypothetical protein
MDYEIRLSAHAARVYQSLPVWLQIALDSHLESLAASPTSLSRRAPSPPYPPGDMLSAFDRDDPDSTRRHHVSVFFVYSQSETSLIVTAVGHFVW